MWLITNGVDIGATTIIGDAVTNYMTEAKYKRQASAEKTYAKLNFIGIVDQKLVKYAKKIAESDRVCLSKLVTIAVEECVESLNTLFNSNGDQLCLNLRPTSDCWCLTINRWT